MRILAIDPGTTESGFVIWDGALKEGGQIPNFFLRDRLKNLNSSTADLVAIEMIASYGMAVGREVFETCLWIGRFLECSPLSPVLVYRKDIKLHLCGTPRAKDANIRQALIDKHGAPGTKKSPGPTYGISGHLWAALAVADYALTIPKLVNQTTQNPNEISK